MVTVVLGRGGAGMVRQDAQSTSNWQIRHGFAAAIPQTDYAVLLIGLRNDEVGKDPALHVADHAIALIDGLRGGTAVTRHGHPARIDKGPTPCLLVADHGGQD